MSIFKPLSQDPLSVGPGKLAPGPPPGEGGGCAPGRVRVRAKRGAGREAGGGKRARRGQDGWGQWGSGAVRGASGEWRARDTPKVGKEIRRVSARGQNQRSSTSATPSSEFGAVISSAAALTSAWALAMATP
ncbi:hypothetical protein GCM10010483_37300 [Actinokineospora diospyrosa]